MTNDNDKTVKDVTLDALASRNPKAVRGFDKIIIVVLDRDNEAPRTRMRQFIRDASIAVSSGVISLWVVYLWPFLSP